MAAKLVGGPDANSSEDVQSVICGLSRHLYVDRVYIQNRNVEILVK